MKHPKSSALIMLIGIALVSLSLSPNAQTMGSPEQFSAQAVDLNTGRTGRVEISVTRWSTPSERETLTSTLFENGQEKLLDKLTDMREVGRIYTPGSIGYELRFAEQQKLPDGGRMIVLATDRPMSFREIVNQPRSADYPFTWVQINMRPDGTGEGTLAVAARVYGDRPNRPIEVENYDIQPVRLQKVTSHSREN